MTGLRSYISRFRTPLAVAGSFLVHLAAVSMFLTPSSGTLSELDTRAVGNQDVEGIDIALLQLADQPSASLANITNAFMPMLENAADNGWKSVDAPKPPQTLSELMGEADAEAQLQKSQTTSPSDKEMHIKVDDRTRETMNDLWKAIEPCWNRLADKNTVAVKLKVSFSPFGNLSKPPVILRDVSSSLSERQLRSESLAINALAQCGPYLMAFGQSDVEVLFPAKR